MATSPSTIDLVLERAGDGIELTAKRMFGEYGLFLDGKMVALVCDDLLFVKATAPGLEILGDHELAPPYTGAKPTPLVPDTFARKPGKLAELLHATARALPAPKPKTSRARKIRS